MADRSAYYDELFSLTALTSSDSNAGVTGTFEAYKAGKYALAKTGNERADDKAEYYYILFQNIINTCTHVEREHYF